MKEEVEHIRRGKHGAANTKQAIAIGLSKARRAGVPLKPPRKGQAPASTRQKAERDYEAGQGKRTPRAASSRRSRVREEVLKREPRSAASSKNLSKQAKQSARKRGAQSRRSAAAKAVRTKGQTSRKAA